MIILLCLCFDNHFTQIRKDDYLLLLLPIWPVSINFPKPSFFFMCLKVANLNDSITVTSFHHHYPLCHNFVKVEIHDLLLADRWISVKRIVERLEISKLSVGLIIQWQKLSVKSGTYMFRCLPETMSNGHIEVDLYEFSIWSISGKTLSLLMKPGYNTMIRRWNSLYQVLKLKDTKEQLDVERVIQRTKSSPFEEGLYFLSWETADSLSEMFPTRVPKTHKANLNQFCIFER